MSEETRPMKSPEGYPIRHLNGGSAGVTLLASAPGNACSHYITGFTLGGGTDGDGFTLLRRNCLRLLSTSDVLTVTDHGNLEPTIFDCSIEMWVKIPSTITTIPKMIHKDDGADDGYFIELTSGAPKATFGDGVATATVTSARAINDNNWHHIWVMLDASEESGLTIYVDGELEGTTASTTVDDLGSITGGATNLTIVGVATYNWYISCVGIHKGANAVRTAAQIKARYNNGIGYKYDGSESGLTAAWNLDEGVGTTSYDVFGTCNMSMADAPVWCPHKRNGSTAPDTTCGAPFDSDNTLDAVGQFVTGLGAAYGSTAVSFPQAIKIGRNNPLRILETDGAWHAVLFGYIDSHA